MAKLSDQTYIVQDQYKDAKNFEARNYLQNHFNQNPYPFMRWVFDWFPRKSRLKILELGCGTGTLWMKNADRIPLLWELTITDISPAMLQETKKNLVKLQNKISYEIVDAQRIPYEDNSFDMVVANHMLYHVPDREKALFEIKRVLKPKGLFFASTVGKGHMKELKDLVKEFDNTLSLWGKQANNLFTLENGAEQLAHYFSAVEKEYYDDKLIVPEDEPLINYVLSTYTGRFLKGKKLKDFRQFITERLKNGTITISKVVGIFMGKKRD